MAGVGVKVIGLAELQARMRLAVTQAPTALDKAVIQGALLVASQAQRNVTTGGTGLRVRTGRLRASIGTQHVAHGVAAVGTNVVYARIHEYGGQTAPHFIMARKPGGVLRFLGKDGAEVFRHIVYHPGSHIPARPYMRPALEKERVRVIALVRKVYAGPLQLGVVDAG